MRCSGAVSSRRRGRGFTLIELLVAMLIFAVLGTVAYRGLFQIQRVNAGTKIQTDQLARLQRTFYWMSDDVAQMVDRPVRSTLGSQIPPLEVSEQGTYFLQFTRSGWSNPAADVLPPRSSLQRVAYSLDGDRLMRNYWYHLDQLDETVTKRRLLLDKVDDVQMRFLHPGGEWHDSWPPTDLEPGDRIMPAAIEFQIEIENMGRITRLFGLPG